MEGVDMSSSPGGILHTIPRVDTIIALILLLCVSLQLFNGTLNVATTTKIRLPLERSMYMMTREALTTVWD